MAWLICTVHTYACVRVCVGMKFVHVHMASTGHSPRCRFLGECAQLV